MKVDIQELYEDILNADWTKKGQIKHLIETDKGNSPLRIKSISDRKKELARIQMQKQAVELLFEDYITIPRWYEDRIKEIKG